MRSPILLALAAAAAVQPANAKETRFWNLTSLTVRSLELASVDTNVFGPNQCLNDPDGAVDHDERLKVVGVVTGVYVARLKLADGRACLARNVRIEAGKVFTIEDRDLVDCKK